jgi:hypothetical protein
MWSNVSGLRSSTAAPPKRVRNIDEQTFAAIWNNHGRLERGSTPLLRLRQAFKYVACSASSASSGESSRLRQYR